MIYHAGDEYIRSYVFVCSQMISEPTLRIAEERLHQATIIRSSLVRDYHKRGRTVGSYPRRDKNNRAGYITHNKKLS
jgi:hypothetical protein